MEVKSTCAACNLVFNSTASFDFHRVGTYEPDTRRCLTLVEMRQKGMVQDGRGQWVKPGRKVVARDTAIAS